MPGSDFITQADETSFGRRAFLWPHPDTTDSSRDELKLFSGARSLTLSQRKAGCAVQWSDTQARASGRPGLLLSQPPRLLAEGPSTSCLAFLNLSLLI